VGLILWLMSRVTEVNLTDEQKFAWQKAGPNNLGFCMSSMLFMHARKLKKSGFSSLPGNHCNVDVDAQNFLHRWAAYQSARRSNTGRINVYVGDVEPKTRLQVW
jgi:hypothetical protein